MNLSELKNYAMNVKPLIKKIQDSYLFGNGPVTLSSFESRKIVEFYLKTLNFMGKIESSQDIDEATR